MIFNFEHKTSCSSYHTNFLRENEYAEVKWGLELVPNQIGVDEFIIFPTFIELFYEQNDVNMSEIIDIDEFKIKIIGNIEAGHGLYVNNVEIDYKNKMIELQI